MSTSNLTIKTVIHTDRDKAIEVLVRLTLNQLNNQQTELIE